MWFQTLTFIDVLRCNEARIHKMELFRRLSVTELKSLIYRKVEMERRQILMIDLGVPKGVENCLYRDQSVNAPQIPFPMRSFSSTIPIRTSLDFHLCSPSRYLYFTSCYWFLTPFYFSTQDRWLMPLLDLYLAPMFSLPWMHHLCLASPCTHSHQA